MTPAPAPSWHAAHELKLLALTVLALAALVNTSSTVPESNGTAVALAGRPLCPPIPPNLQGRIKLLRSVPDIAELERKFTMLAPGGRHRPAGCQARNRVAILVPYRDRALHLSLLLGSLHPLLQRQQLDYGIFVVEQFGKRPFNRGMLINVGFVEALKLYDFDCFVFHDVDLVPEDDRNLYTCSKHPRHLSVAIDAFSYKLPHAHLFGGVTALSRSQFQTVNGFSNKFWGWVWGGDDDLSHRIKHFGLHVSRNPPKIARYKMLDHVKAKPNPKRYSNLFKGQKRYRTDGLNSLHYSLKETSLNALYTHFVVELQTSS